MADWDGAVKEADEDQPADLEDLLRSELVNLWHDLETSMRDAYNGRWSVHCDRLTGRIVTLTRFVGVAPWEQVPATLLVNGTYQGIMSAAGFRYAQPDMVAVHKTITASQ